MNLGRPLARHVVPDPAEVLSASADEAFEEPAEAVEAQDSRRQT